MLYTEILFSIRLASRRNVDDFEVESLTIILCQYAALFATRRYSKWFLYKLVYSIQYQIGEINFF